MALFTGVMTSGNVAVGAVVGSIFRMNGGSLIIVVGKGAILRLFVIFFCRNLAS